MNSAELSDMLDFPASEHEEAVRHLSMVGADTQFFLAILYLSNPIARDRV